MEKKKKKKSNKRSLANLVPGGNFRSGAYAFRRTGRIPAEHSDIAEEAGRFEKDLNREYCQPGNFILNRIQAVPIRRLVSENVFAELLITYLWRQVGQAGSEGLGQVLALSAWGDWSASSNRMVRLFRQLNRNLKDFA